MTLFSDVPTDLGFAQQACLEEVLGVSVTGLRLCSQNSCLP